MEESGDEQLKLFADDLRADVLKQGFIEFLILTTPRWAVVHDDVLDHFYILSYCYFASQVGHPLQILADLSQLYLFLFEQLCGVICGVGGRVLSRYLSLDLDWLAISDIDNLLWLELVKANKLDFLLVLLATLPPLRIYLFFGLLRVCMVATYVFRL